MKKTMLLPAIALVTCHWFCTGGKSDTGPQPPDPCDESRFQTTPRKYILAFDIVEGRQESAGAIFKKYVLPGISQCFSIREQADGQYGIHPFELIVLPVTGKTQDEPPILRYVFNRKTFKQICYLKEGAKQESNTLQRQFADGLKQASNPEQCFQSIALLRRLAELVKGADPEHTRILLFSDMLDEVKGSPGSGVYSFIERREEKTVISPYGVEEAMSDADGWIRENIIANSSPLKGHTIRIFRPRWRDPELHAGTGNGYFQTVRRFWDKMENDIGCEMIFEEASDCKNLEW